MKLTFTVLSFLCYSRPSDTKWRSRSSSTDSLNSIDWNSESAAADFESRISEILEDLKEMKRRLESEIEDGEAAMNAEATVCTFLSTRRREIRRELENEKDKNEAKLNEKTDEILNATNLLLQVINLFFLNWFDF